MKEQEDVPRRRCNTGGAQQAEKMREEGAGRESMLYLGESSMQMLGSHLPGWSEEEG